MNFKIQINEGGTYMSENRVVLLKQARNDPEKNQILKEYWAGRSSLLL